MHNNALLVGLGLGVAILVLCIAIAALRGSATKRPHPVLPYSLVSSLLTPAEHRFFTVLATAIDPHMIICCKVRLADVLELPRGTPEWRAHFNRVQSKHLDFVLCHRDDLAPLLAIELDDSSHNRADRRERDAFLNQACEDARLPLLRVPVKRSYSAAEIAERIRSILDRASAA